MVCYCEIWQPGESEKAFIERVLPLEKATRFTHDKRRAQSFCAYILAEYMLCDMLGFAPAKIGFTKQGAPFFKECALRFSVSHSGEYAACIIDESVCGVDIERIRPIPERVKRGIFTGEELEFLQGVDGEKDAVTLWTMKEAYVKTLGKGISRGIAEVSFVKEGKLADVEGLTLSSAVAGDYVLTWVMAARCGEDSALNKPIVIEAERIREFVRQINRSI